MTNMRLIDEAVKLVIDLFEAEGIMESTATIQARATEWYNKTEIVDAEMLAAATITGSYQVGTSWDDLLNWKEFYFPSTPIEEIIARIGGYHFDDGEERVREDFELLNALMEEEELLAMENFHISEIEAAQRDAMWQ